jgi:hypothetical protein
MIALRSGEVGVISSDPRTSALTLPPVCMIAEAAIRLPVVTSSVLAAESMNSGIDRAVASRLWVAVTFAPLPRAAMICGTICGTRNSGGRPPCRSIRL